MSVTIKLSNGNQKSLEVPDLGITVAQFKDIASSLISIPADEQRVILRGKVLKDTDVLSSVGLEYGHAVHIVRGQKSAILSSTASSHATTGTQGVSSQSGSTAVQNNTEAVNPYMSLLGNPNASSNFTGNVTNPQSMNQGVNGGWPLPSGDITAQMLQNPAFQQILQEMMRNPQFMQQVMQMSMQNPSANSGMGMGNSPMSPELMQQSMQMMSNPALLQEVLRMVGNNPELLSLGMPNLQQNSRASLGTPQSTPSGINPSQSQGDPRAIYQSQLQQLREMGFPNEEANIAALQQSQGNLDFAIERLLNA